jgi:hypothetical protein
MDIREKMEIWKTGYPVSRVKPDIKKRKRNVQKWTTEKNCYIHNNLFSL